MVDRSGWIVKRAVRGAGAWTDFPHEPVLSHTSRPTDTGGFFMQQACLSTPVPFIRIPPPALCLL